MNSFDYLEPRSVADAVRMLADHGTRARLLAGGTDLLVQMEMRRYTPETVIFLGRVAELAGISWDPSEGLRIGAGVTLRQVENHPVIVASYPALARASKEVGSVQIRNLATLAGNVCNASPSADTSPALLAYDAAVEIAGPSGRHVAVISDFWTGPGGTTLQDGEMVTSIRIPPAPDGLRSFYYKLAVRKAMDLAMVGVSASLVPSGGGAERVRIALGAVAPVCFRAREAEAAIEERGASAIEEAAALAREAASPIDDHRASAAYRLEMVRVLTARALRSLLG